MDKSVTVNLKSGERYRFSGKENSIRSIDGVFWITWKGGEDIILRPGESLQLQGKRRVVAQVLKPGGAEVVSREWSRKNYRKRQLVDCAA